MKLTVGLADAVIGIDLLGQAERAVPLCREIFKDFLYPELDAETELKVIILNNQIKTLPIVQQRGRKRVIEEQLLTKDAMVWLDKIHWNSNDFKISESMIASYCLGGLLLFDPETSNGCVILQDGPGCFRPIYRLCWMYLAQVLGERKACFIHSAALVRDGKGYLFIGESGAGKSTLAGLCNGSIVFSDDRPVFCERNGSYYVYPSPYRQTSLLKGQGGNVIGLCAMAAGFYFIFKDNQTYLTNISTIEAISDIISRHILFFKYLSMRARSNLFDLLFEACHKISMYKLYFCLDQDIWETIESSNLRLT